MISGSSNAGALPARLPAAPAQKCPCPGTALSQALPAHGSLTIVLPAPGHRRWLSAPIGTRAAAAGGAAPGTLGCILRKKRSFCSAEPAARTSRSPLCTPKSRGFLWATHSHWVYNPNPRRLFRRVWNSRDPAAGWGCGGGGSSQPRGVSQLSPSTGPLTGRT